MEYWNVGIMEKEEDRTLESGDRATMLKSKGQMSIPSRPLSAES